MLIDMSKSCKCRLILSKTKNCEKLSDHLVFCRNILTNRQLTISRLSANCLDGLQMRGIPSGWFADERNCQMAGIACVGWTLKIWMYRAGIRNQFCPSGASSLPMMRKQRSPVGQAACPFKDIKPLCLKFENNTQHPYWSNYSASPMGMSSYSPR